MNYIDKVPVTVSVSGLDLLALKKLSLVSHALAEKMGGSAGDEQRTLAGILDDVIRQIEIGAATAAAE